MSTHRDTLKRKYHIQRVLRFPWAWCVPITAISWVTVDSQASSPYLNSQLLLQTGPQLLFCDLNGERDSELDVQINSRTDAEKGCGANLASQPSKEARATAGESRK